MIAPESLHGQMVYLDSNILVYFMETPIQTPDNQHPFLNKLFQNIEIGLTLALTSQLTLAEVLVLPLREGNIPLEQAYRRILRGTPHFPVAPITLTILNKTADIRARYKGIKIADAIHIATAMESACDLILTADKQFRQCEREIPVSILE